MRAKEQRIEQERAQEAARITQEREDREHADQILNWGGEFWGGLLVNGYVNGYVDESALRDATNINEEFAQAVVPEPLRATPLMVAHIEEADDDVEDDESFEDVTIDMDVLDAALLDDGEETEEDTTPTAIAA